MIAKQLREQAAIICSIMACERARKARRVLWATDAIAYLDLLFAHGRAGAVAEAAFRSTDYMLPLHEQWAEADARLRTGWSP